MAKQGSGKRAGSRRAAAKKRSRVDPVLLLLTLAVTVLVVAWGYLVKAAIDFGSEARDGESIAWLFLALACVGAAGCLFIGLILIAKLLALVGVLPETATGPSNAELGPQTAREAPSTYVPVTESYADTLRSFGPPATEPEVDEHPTGSHAAIRPTGDAAGEDTRVSNPRYPGGKRAAR